MTIQSEQNRDATQMEYERMKTCLVDCEAYDLFRQADDEFLRDMEGGYGSLEPDELAEVTRLYHVVTRRAA